MAEPQSDALRSDATDPASPESVVVIRFKAQGSSEFEMRTERVTPMQLLALAAYLDEVGRAQLRSMFAARESRQQRIAVPALVVPGNGHA